jgi:hypothetical protein
MLGMEKEMEEFDGQIRLALGISEMRKCWVQGWQEWLMKKVKKAKCVNIG